MENEVSGSKWDQDPSKIDWSYLPSKPIEEVLKIYAGGAKKYGRGNYQKGIHYSRVFSAAMRHLWAWWRGEDTDAESGLSHLAHAAWNVLTLLEYTQDQKYKSYDDRVNGVLEEHDKHFVSHPSGTPLKTSEIISPGKTAVIHGSFPLGSKCDTGDHDWVYSTSYATTGGLRTKYVCRKCNSYFFKMEPEFSVPFSQTIPQEPLPASITTSTPCEDGHYYTLKNDRMDKMKYSTEEK